ncbi:MAG: hypothetical protein IRZ21_11610, partial [Thermoleophilaceae bacterium]|nr:hypothetical protein [Thermoleophilaceae bacterium]
MRARAVIGIPLAAAALALGGCGGGNGRHAIPRSDARGILTRLDQVDANVEAGKCGSAAAEVADLRRRVADLPRSVDGDVRRALRDGVATLARLVEDQCRRPEPTPTETTPTETVPTETTPTETVPTETTPTETVPTQTTPTQTAPS